MNKELKIVVIKFMVVTIFVLIYVAIIAFVVAPYLTDQAFHKAYGQQFQNPGDQFQNPQFQGQFDQNQGQYGNNQFDQNQQFGQNQQYGNNQFQQPYPQQYGGGTPYMNQGYNQGYPQQQGYGGFDIQSIIAALAAGGGATVYARRRANSLEGSNQQLYGEVLKGKQVDVELARMTSRMNPEVSNQINDLPAVKLDNLTKDVNDFSNQVAQA